MAAYLSAAKKAAIKARMRAPNKTDIGVILDEVAVAIAADGGDPATAIDTAIATGGAIVVAIDATAEPLSALSSALTSYFEAIRPDYAANNVADLDQDVSAGYVEAEVQAISDKVDAILLALKSAGVMTADA
jgi:hypothetical protein